MLMGIGHMSDQESTEPRNVGNPFPMVAKPKAGPKAHGLMAASMSWDSQTTGSGSDEEEVCSFGFSWEALTVFPTTVTANALARRECKDYMPLQVLRRAPSCKGYCRPNQEMILAPRQVASSFFIYKADITAAHKCLLAADFKQPRCAGDGCIPCVVAHMKLLHGRRLTIHAKKVTHLWHRTLQMP